MATFFEIKQLICRLFGIRDIVDDDEDITVDIRPLRVPSSDEQENYQFVIVNAELQELYDKVCSMRNDALELYTGYDYEVGIDLDYPIMRNQEFPVISEDIANSIQYELGVPTIEYCIYLLIQIKDTMNQQQGRNSRILPMRLRRPFDRYVSNNDNISLATLLPKMIGELSLKIKNMNSYAKDLSSFRNYKTSFVFEFMYKSGIALIEFTDIIDMFHMNNSIRGRLDVTQISTPPLRKYTNDVVDYYKQALASNDPYIKFISFYHVMEYFFDEVFKRKLVTDLKDKITHPDFSYKNEDKIYDIALFVKNRLRMNDETGQGNELESLKYVLSEYISIDDLKARIDAIDLNALQYYKNNK